MKGRLDMNRVTMFVFWVMIFCSTHAQASEGVANTSGLAVSANLGYQGRLVGVTAAYYLVVAENITVSPYVGGGVWPGDQTLVGGTGGIMFSYGYRHRAFADVNFGLAAIETFTGTGYYGMTGAAGYEFLGEGGILFRVSGGYSMMTTKLPTQSGAPTFNLSLGYKFF